MRQRMHTLIGYCVSRSRINGLIIVNEDFSRGRELKLVRRTFETSEYDAAEKMAKLILYVFVALLAASLIMGTPDKCGRHGDPCVSALQCCPNLRCHSYANRCQVIITEEELMAQREKILGRKGKDY